MEKKMRQGKYWLAISLAFLLMCVACTEEKTAKEKDSTSIVDSLSLKLDFMNAEFARLEKRADSLSQVVSSLRDTVKAMESKEHTHPKVMFGGEPKGDPIRSGD